MPDAFRKRKIDPLPDKYRLLPTDPVVNRNRANRVIKRTRIGRAHRWRAGRKMFRGRIRFIEYLLASPDQGRSAKLAARASFSSVPPTDRQIY